MKFRVSVGLAALTATCACAFAGGASAATDSTKTAARDAASTRAYIAGEVAIDRATLRHGPAELAAGKRYVAALDRECPIARAKPPHKMSLHKVMVFLHFAIEVETAYLDTAWAPVRPAVERVAHEQERLRFSDPAVQWRVHGGTSALAALLALRPPDVCADVRRLEATRFRAMTTAGARFSREALLLITGEGSPAGLMRRMRSYAPTPVTTGLRRLEALDRRVERSPAVRLSDRMTRGILDDGTRGVSSGALIGTKL